MPETTFNAVRGKDTRMAWGTHTTATADDAVATGLRVVENAVATLQDAPVVGAAYVSADIGSDGKIQIRTWKPTGTADTTPVAATTFGLKVQWFAIGG